MRTVRFLTKCFSAPNHPTDGEHPRYATDKKEFTYKSFSKVAVRGFHNAIRPCNKVVAPTVPTMSPAVTAMARSLPTMSAAVLTQPLRWPQSGCVSLHNGCATSQHHSPFTQNDNVVFMAPKMYAERLCKYVQSLCKQREGLCNWYARLWERGYLDDFPHQNWILFFHL